MRRYTIAINGKDVVVDVRELAAERFQVSVGGSTYDVTVSEESEIITKPVGTAAGWAPAPVVSSSSPGAETGAAPLIRAPMPGVILSVEVAQGAMVTRGQALLTLEAMKMRNAIRSPRDGVVTAVHVAAGQNVAHGDPLVEVTAP